MIVGDAYAAAHEAGYRIVGGECGSVGIASGYTQGGGHSMLNTAYGMAADQVLEWEVVAPTGQYLTATPEQNSDLYWALSGGGGGTYGIVLSMTVKIYPDGPVAGGSLTFAKTNESAYWKAVGLWFQQTPRLVQDNNTLIFLVQDDGFGVVSMTLPDRPESAVATLLQPYLDELDDLGIVYNLTTTYFEYYLEHFAAFFGPLPYGPNDPSGILINRIIPRSIVESDSSTAQLMDAFKDTVSGGDFLVGCSVMNVANTSWTSNAVLPAWRNTSVACNVNGHWNYTAPLATNINTKRRLTEVHMPAIEAASPGGGVYLNEMDPFYRNPDWKGQLFGENYEGLLQVKDKYDPQRVLWGNFSVASDEKVLDGSGRLCKLPIS
jgi:FAD/FMN-containing dehydrogenase